VCNFLLECLRSLCHVLFIPVYKVLREKHISDLSWNVYDVSVLMPCFLY
jgi:hypothetical protein